MNNYAKIRALIPDLDSAKRPRDVAALLPDIDAQAIREALGYMYGTGIVDRVGNRSDGFRYFVIREVKLKAYATPEESAAAKRERDRLYAKRRGKRTDKRKAGVRPMAEWRAEQARRREATAQRRAEERAALRNRIAKKQVGERLETAKAAKGKRVARLKRSNHAYRQRTQAQRLLANEPHQAVRLREAAPVKQVPAETIEQWMARTGQRPQVLPVAWNEARAAG